MPEHNATSIGSWERLPPEETRQGIKAAAAEMGGLVRTTLGPVGVDKMIVRRMDDDRLRTFITNDGVAIIEEFEGETDHPIANQFIHLAEAHEDELGDGTTTMTLLASELATAGIDLIEEGVPPAAVVDGFSIGAQRTLEVWDEIGIPVADTPQPMSRGSFDESKLEQIAHCGMTNGRQGEWRLEELSSDVVEAVLRAWEPQRGTVHLGYVSIEAIPGGDAGASELIPGTLHPYEPMAGNKHLPVDGGVLVIEGSLEPRSIRANVTISGDYDGSLGGLGDDASTIADAVAQSNADAVFVTGDVTAAIGTELATRGIVCFRNVKESDLERLSRVTGATIRGPVTPTAPGRLDDCGRGQVRLRDAEGDKTWLEVTAPDGLEPRSLGFVVRGGTESTAAETRRRIKVGLNAVRAAVKRPVALPGGGAAELEAARAVTDLAPKFDGREQLAIERFGAVLESLPRTLARNAAHDPIDAMAELRARHDAGHGRAGIDANGRLVNDVVAESDALDAQLVRTSCLTRSVEFTNSLLTIDGVVFNTAPPFDPDEVPTPRRGMR
ncbi:chaperonin Cpn60 [Natronolimnobius sp. AArcel1]|uniref:TCP-1/cpn60 chaperonin family protein n=1 Tax=Natronolimnobius sp. AArcel1 TaxID=1679093 RepID=UPI0013E9F660|nr:TCP-1/cpn60 chaperonin family protein [Natronolimnobius sp. AArcel1]NGM69998.1 chaperonin Cpn60 [Natronolimnobius sp. AArcel1]